MEFTADKGEVLHSGRTNQERTYTVNGWALRSVCDLSLRAVAAESNASGEDDQADSQEAAVDGASELPTDKLLREMQESSMQMIAELDELETQLEVERVCRETAEVFAVKLSKENRQLQRLSLALQPLWDRLPEDLSKLEDQGNLDPSEEPTQCYQLQVKELQGRIFQLMEEKKLLASKVRELESREAGLQEKAEKEQDEKRSLQNALENQNKRLQQLSAVSTRVTQEYQELQQHLELEQNLRQKAEIYAHQMRVRTQEVNRQSVILLQHSEPDVQVMKAMEEVGKVTHALETERIQHQQQVKELQAQIEGSEWRKEVERLQLLLQLAEDKQAELEARAQQAERRNQELESKVEDLREKRLATDGAMPGAEEQPVSIPSPPPLPPPLMAAPIEPLADLLRKRQKEGKKRNDSAGLSVIKRRAVDEMMERIKSGVVLKPAKRRTEPVDATSSNKESKGSAVAELQGILSTMGKHKARQHSWKLEKRQNELDAVLLRRRKVTDMREVSTQRRVEGPGVEPGDSGVGSPDKVPDESPQPAWDRTTSLGQGFWQTGGMRQSRRTSAITALNRRGSQDVKTPPTQLSPPTGSAETLTLH
ncbi:shootin-1 [Narcine bancroftii]|uniref:shootin-1 n=1 Tax=Narcine bancroftii TaxID=1343680 RepID=UPI003831D67D